MKNIGKEGIKHAVNKPFSDDDCCGYLAEIAAVMSLAPALPAKLLDLGCGTGWTSLFLAKRGYNVIGQDISKDMISYANINREKEELKNISFIVGDYENMSFENEFDCVIFFDSLHHAADEKKAIFMAYKALKCGGRCIISEPGYGHEKSPKSIEAVKKYNVTEKSMLPKHIIKIGEDVGFKKYSIYPHSRDMNKIVYGKIDKINKIKYFQRVFGLNLFRCFLNVFLLAFYKRYSGIVVLIK